MPSPDGNAGFGAALLRPDLPVPEGLSVSGGRSPKRRFGVYRNNVVVGLVDCLLATFPALAALLGADYFRALARLYVAGHPPRSPVLILYGDTFPDFVERFPPLADYPYLGDVGRLEWAWLSAYHAVDEAVLAPGALALLPAEALDGLRLVAHPAARLVASRWPVFELARANRFELGSPQPGDLHAAQTVLVTRPDVDVELRSLDPGTAALAAALLGGATLGAASELAVSADPDLVLADGLAVLLASGAFAGLAP
ncbi:DNA-binding domain-containing protein [Polymorphum gilvum]|uniref:Hypothetical conserved protein n=1 Tax=Polymorphum gilvum (strain LMG 25793 / CGMCC 1.9160 / SL003B-26A1) TaxID=991905 RepID=F2IWI2_POLGS|nr:DNA-binding domain-containing protein [Polymorphum gilvum]ADZ69281.1 Hypothetical conserved protein [Polymorphum gilvum SL003B-26A1]